MQTEISKCVVQYITTSNITDCNNMLYAVELVVSERLGKIIYFGPKSQKLVPQMFPNSSNGKNKFRIPSIYSWHTLMGLIFARTNFRELEYFAFREDLFLQMSCFTIFRQDLLSRIGYDENFS